MNILLTLDEYRLMRKFISHRNQDLRTDDIYTGDFLSDGMFYLDPGIHFDKINILFPVHQKLDRTCIDIMTCWAILSAASYNLSRVLCFSPILGAISTTFWNRRCTEQSLS